MTGPLVATYRHRKGRFVPVVCWQGGEYECGPELGSADAAVRLAVAFAAAIRDTLRAPPPEGQSWG